MALSDKQRAFVDGSSAGQNQHRKIIDCVIVGSSVAISSRDPIQFMEEGHGNGSA